MGPSLPFPFEQEGRESIHGKLLALQSLLARPLPIRIEIITLRLREWPFLFCCI